MPIAHAMWIHGDSVRIEYPDRMEGDTRRGGAYYKMMGSRLSKNWFHAAIPTALIVEGRRLRLDSVMLRFRTRGAAVTKVHVYDGENQIASHEGLSLSSRDWLFERFAVPDPKPEIFWGVGISFEGEYDRSRERRIDISAAGADFL